MKDHLVVRQICSNSSTRPAQDPVFLTTARPWVLRGSIAALVTAALFSASVCESAPVVVTYNTAGTTSFTAPVGVFTIQVETWGGGGAGGAGRKDTATGSNTSQNGGGGGGGAYAARLAVPVGLLPFYTIVIPAAAVSGTNGTTTNNSGAVNGGDVTFTGDSGVQVKANGGSGGRNAYTTVNGTVGVGGGAGGTVALSVGDSGYVFAGGAGSSGNTGSTNVSGSGGGGAGTTATGGNAVTFTSPTSPTPPLHHDTRYRWRLWRW